MERLKLVNVEKSTFLASKLHTFTIRSLEKTLLLTEMHRVFTRDSRNCYSAS